MRESRGAIDSQRHTVDIAIFYAEADHVGELSGQAGTAHWRVSIKPVLDFLGHLGAHRGREDAGGDRSDTDFEFAEIASHGQDDTVYGALARAVSGLTALGFLSGDAADEQDDTLLTLLIHSLVLRHSDSSILSHIDGAKDVDSHDSLEGLCVEWSARGQRGSDPSDASACNSDVNGAENSDGLLDGALDLRLLCHIARDAEDALLKLSVERLHPGDIHVGDDNRGTLRVHLANGFLTEA
mmetsp:Transcript_22088/g.27164  ORF Transcript_22088/g.27164 Transcript_22088/m.27164 type:complete len:240 (+) Transcript_22088:104-823(+)